MTTQAITDTAFNYLHRSLGYEIVDRSDQLGLVAWNRKQGTMIFCIVKRCEDPNAEAPFSTDKQRREYRIAVNRWCRENRWTNTAIRVDLIRIGGDERQPTVDHIRYISIR